MRRLAASAFVAAVVVVVAVCSPLMAKVTLPHIIDSNMVLQRDIPLPIWGWADPGEQITVAIAGQKLTTKADESGRWQVKLAALPGSDKPLEMTVEGTNTIHLDNILVGEVWVCSGQSNMQMSVGGVVNADKEIAAADCPTIRLFTAPRVCSPRPTSDVAGTWAVCAPPCVKDFSAVGYFFGRDLQKEIKVPIGLISTNWGGTRIEPWTPAAAFADVPALQNIAELVQGQAQDDLKGLPPLIPSVEAWVKAARAAQAAGQSVPPPPALPGSLLGDVGRPCSLYNGMVSALVPFGIRGAIWYQGEANVKDGMLYTEKTKALVGGWRKAWGQGDFPFYYVQIAPYNYGPDVTALPMLWQAQRAALAIPNTGMAVINDIGDIKDIHPKNKQEVGRRLSLWALAKTYGKQGLEYSGPLYKAMKVEGDKIRVSFDHVGGGLAARDGAALTWFQVAAADGTFVDAKAVIDGDTVVVASEDVKEPVAVRFAWSQIAEPNLMNQDGLPASAFQAGQIPASLPASRPGQ